MKRIKMTTVVPAIAVVFGIMAATPAPARAADRPTANWQVQITPYVWMTGITGDVHAGDVSGSIGVSFSDIMDSLDFGLMGLFQARKGRWAFTFDGMYARLTKEGTSSGFVGEAETVYGEIVTQVYSLAVSYRVLDGRIPIDIGTGVRVMPISTTLTVTSGTLEGRSAAGSNSAVDGFVLVRAELPLTRRLAIDGFADIGAGDSKLSWEAMGGLKVGLSGAVSLKFGYRYLSIHNESPTLSTTIAEGGFYLGVGIRL